MIGQYEVISIRLAFLKGTCKTSRHVFLPIAVSFDQIVVDFTSRSMATHKQACKVRVLVRLRPERPDYKEKGGCIHDGIPERCVRAVDSSTLELWNCRNSEESIRYR